MGCLVVILVMLLYSNTCKGQDSSSSQVTEYVTGGSRAPRGRFPYMCSIRIRTTEAHVCGGILIDENWMMTAAHCLDPSRPDSAEMSPTVYCNIYEREEQNVSKKFAPIRCYLHHLWDGKVINGDDIALCQLERSVAVDIPGLANIGDGFSKSDAFSALEWGTTSSRGDLADVLQIGFPLLYLASSACNIMGDWAGRIKDSMICAGRGNPNTCKGDSGGALFLRHDPENREKDEDPQSDLIVGITSFGDADCEADLPGVYTKVSCYRTWIDCIMKGAEEGCSHHDPCGGDSSPPSSPFTPSPFSSPTSSAKASSPDSEDTSLCSGVQNSATFAESKALERVTRAIESDDSETVKKILCDGLSSNIVQGDHSDSLLIRAAQYDAIESSNVLLQRGAKIDYENSQGQTAMSRAAAHDAIRVAKLLIDSGADIDKKDTSGWTPLHHASNQDSLEVAKELISHGADVNSEDNLQLTPLHYASQRGSLEIVKELIADNASANSRDHRDWTPLHFAAKRNFVALAKELIAADARVNSATNDRSTPLHFAARENSVAVARELIANDADVEAEDNEGASPLLIAAYRGSERIVRILLDGNARVDSVDYDGRSALYLAATRGHFLIVRILLDNRASRTLTDNAGETPVDVICDESPMDEPCSDEMITRIKQLLEP